MTKKDEKELEALMSAALVRDIVERHLDSDFNLGKKGERCGFCNEHTKPSNGTIYVKNFDKKREIPLCSSECKDAHEYHEMQFFGCADLENLPEIPRRQKTSRKDLVRIYIERMLATRQNAIDEISSFRQSYQLKEEE